MPRNQRSLKSAVELEGVALHSGRTVKLRLEPAAVGTGLVFRRSDLEDPVEITALPGNLINSARRTVLRTDNQDVGMIEHLLAACQGLKVDNLVIQVEGDELPGFDGSVKPYADALRKGVIVEQKAERKVLSVQEPVLVRDSGNEIIALPPSGEGLRVRYLPELPEGFDATPVLFDSADGNFEREVAPARTFVRAEEVESLLAAGFGKGATAENTLVIGGEELPELRLDREPTRHKIADILGDLMLLGADLHADLIATRSGHTLNQELVRLLRAQLEALELAVEPRETGYEIRELFRILPHRYPFLLVDRILEMEGTRRAVGIKNVSINEHYFQGHWPGHPVMPGVLQLESMAQVAGVLLLRRLEHTGKVAVLASIDKVRFRGAVVPGDQLRIEVDTLRLNRHRGQVRGTAKVGLRTVAEAILSFALVDV
ncbi:MAG: UDP-3-O-[3-hydroxymyristoyl] N-acetylglucosamine deacetylase [Planctomycetes bacterium]|nr:UDP-3-O-[3-hydroxymyristoyl] N-acetylglucosamine deacetylase [Planctomycetota bacterium]MBL7007631.1 UDP-3-O-[3-hydroxymyristoyl] N-acetylglucosamine deacetylase [Planctomycetota bacterium]